MRVRVLGPLEVWDDGHELPLGSGRQRALFVLLLLHAGEVVSRDRLIDGLWGERPPASAAKVLQGYVSQLRRTLPPETIVTRGSGYLLRGGETDVNEFERLVERARDEAASEAALTLREALALWRGGALAEVEYEAWAQAELARLEELRLVAIEERIEADLRLGGDAHLVPELEALVAAHPLRERLRAQLMLALYRAGRQTGALDAFADARHRLVDELGIEPGKSLRELHQAILRQDPKLEPATAAESPAERSPFVGREREFAQLIAGLDGAFAGHGGLFLLVGEPGIGKSRLTEELLHAARGRGARVLVGRCWEAGGAPAYWPWVQLLRACIDRTEPAALRAQLGVGAPALAELLPELRELFPDLPEAPELESASTRFHLFEAAASFLMRAAKVCPLVVGVDDLHAADEPSLLLLQFLARQLGESRVLVVGAYRDVDPSPSDPLMSALAELVREPVTTRLALTGLGQGDVGRFIKLTAGEMPSARLVATIHGKTDGNPLFVGEIVRLLATEGRLEDAAAMSRVAIPQSVRDVIAHRLRHLSRECCRLLVLASVFGREFAVEALARVGGASENQLLDNLDEALRERIVSDVPGGLGRLRFAHVLIRDTLYEGITAARRPQHHRLALAALEALYGEEPGPHLAELTHHAVGAREFDKAIQYAWRAGDRSLALSAYEEATRLYETALDALAAAREPEPATECELLLALGHAQVRAGAAVAAKQTFLSAAEVARRLGQGDALARAALGYGGRFVWSRAGGDNRLVPLLREALAAADDRDPALRVRLLTRLATALRDEPDSGPRDLLSREAVDIARTADEAATLTYALVGRYAANWSPANTHERMAIATELVGLAQETGDKEREVEGHGFRLHALLELGDVQAADADLAARRKLTNEMHQPAQLVVQLWLESMRSLLVGDFTAAEETIHQAFELGRRTMGDEAHVTFELQRFVLRREQGRLAEIERALESCANMFPTRLAFQCLLANLSFELERSDEAEDQLRALAADDYKAFPLDNESLFGLALLAETCAGVDDRANAASLYRLLLPYSEQNVADGTEVSTGAVARYLGLLACSMKSFDDAAHHFERALALNAHMRALPWLAHTQHEYASMLVVRGAPEDRQKAQELLDAALSGYRELGMKSYAQKASALARKAGATA